MNHPHYLWMGHDVGNRIQIISAGCARDESRTFYKATKPDGKPRWNPGFAYVYEGYGYIQHANEPLPEFWGKRTVARIRKKQSRRTRGT